MSDRRLNDQLPPPWHLPRTRLLARVSETVRRFVRDHQLWRRGDTVGWACSGGADSLAGLRLMAHLRRSLGHHIAVLHVDHRLAADRATAESWVRQAADALELPLLVARVDVGAGAGLEGRARQLRYAALADLAQQAGCRVVATAHHADDQAETLLMRLCRGAGPESLAGIAAARQDGVVRPLLAVTRAELLQLHGDMPCWQDPSNRDLHHARNRVRALGLPALLQVEAGAVAGLSRTAEALALAATGTAAWIDLALQGRAQVLGQTVAVPRDAVPADDGARALLLRWVCAQLGAPAPSVAAVGQFIRMARRPAAGSCQIAGANAVQSRTMWHFSAASARPSS